MLKPSSDLKYRSVKYSISASSLKKHTFQKMERDNQQCRLSLLKENSVGVQRPKTSNILKSSQPQKRWNNNTISSSNYKLRLVANSSYVRRQQDEKEAQQEGHQQVTLFKSHYITPYEDYHCNLQEVFQALPPLLHADQLQTKQIKMQLDLLGQKAESQLKQTEEYFCHQINKLKTLMCNTFKSHSRQIINARDNMNMLHESLGVLKGKCLMISQEIARLNDNFNA